ncbi:MAG: 30S ribosomal protein S6 [Patescibacteria group bacterium]|nr:30S ribosomal protein S6 [Patescibacteria group bacterium]
MVDIKEGNKITDSDKIYEVGYFLVPSIPENKALEEMEIIHSIVTKEGGVIISSDTPKLQPLAYNINKHDEGYFGWVKFEIQSSLIDSIKKALDSQSNILRYLLISTVKESTLASQKPIVVVEKDEDKKLISVEEIDMKIDAMVKEV